MGEPAKKRRRVQRRTEESRRKIAQAWLDLIKTGDLSPPIEAVARRAGVSRSLVFHHFKSAGTLLREASRLQREINEPLFRAAQAAGSFAERLWAFVESRARLYEEITPTRRAARLVEHSSPVMAKNLRLWRERKRAQTSQAFAPELDALGEAEREGAERALQAAASWANWEALRAHQGLSVAEARESLALLLCRVLGQPLP